MKIRTIKFNLFLSIITGLFIYAIIEILLRIIFDFPALYSGIFVACIITGYVYEKRGLVASFILSVLVAFITIFLLLMISKFGTGQFYDFQTYVNYFWKIPILNIVIGCCGGYIGEILKKKTKGSIIKN